MSFFEVFSRRNQLVEITDVYQYEEVPQEFRNQFINLIKRLLPNENRMQREFWSFVEDEVKIELGLLNFKTNYMSDDNIYHFFARCNNIEALDVIDILVYQFKNLSNLRSYHSDLSFFYENLDSTLARINQKFLQNGLGYAIEGNQLVKIDNQFIHSEIVKKAILLLHNNEFESVSEEFLQAHEQYKKGNYKDSIVNANKAFESTMKIICSKKRYQFSQSDTANKLVSILYQNELIPSFMQSQFTGLRTTLENSVNTLRNKYGGHGQGEEIIHVPDSIIQYTLNLCATNIVFLVELYNESK